MTPEVRNHDARDALTRTRQHLVRCEPGQDRPTHVEAVRRPGFDQLGHQARKVTSGNVGDFALAPWISRQAASSRIFVPVEIGPSANS